MNRGISWAFLAVSVAFFLFIVGLTGYRLEDTRTRNSLQARDRLIELAARVGAIRSTYVSLDSLSARKELRTLFDAQPRLLLLSVHSPSQGILYLVARNQSYLKDPAVPSPQWRGTPTYQVENGYEVALSRPLAAAADSSGAMMDAVFVIMGREDLYPIVRDDLYLFLAFLFVSGVVILIVMSVQDVPAGNTGTPPGTPGSASAAPPSPSGAASPRSGLIRGEHFEPKLRWELEKTIAEGQDMSLARIRIDDPHADSQLPAVYTEVARVLLIRFPAHDCLFETAGDALTAIIPETDIDVAVKNLEAFRKAVGGRPIEGRPRSLSIGVASRGGRLISASTLLEEADISLEKACREGGNQVIGFRADPSRYPGSLSAVR